MANIVKEINEAVDECGGEEFNPNPPNVMRYKDLQIERENRENYIEVLLKEIDSNEKDIIDLNKQIEYMDEKIQDLQMWNKKHSNRKRQLELFLLKHNMYDDFILSIE